MGLIEPFLNALNDPKPLESLYRTVKYELYDGGNRSEILYILEQLRQELRNLGEQEKEEIVLEVMDFLVGWCNPDLAL